MRFALPALLLASTIALAAPVPADLTGNKAKFEHLWNDLAAPLWVDRARAVCELLDHPKGVEFLAQKVVPVSATADDLKSWLKAINSDDEKLWKPALAELEYHDPRTALTPAEQIEQVDTDVGKKRLMNIWLPGFFQNPERMRNVKLMMNGSKVSCEWLLGEDEFSTEFEVPRFSRFDRPVWQRVALAAHVLHRADTKVSRDALARIADGHKDALPSKLAADLLKAKLSSAPDKFTNNNWDALLFAEPGDMVSSVVALREAKNVATVLKEKLPTIQATKEQLTKWLQALDSEDNAVWGAAFDKLCYYRPSLALTLHEQLDRPTTLSGRLLLFQLWSQDIGRSPGRMQFDKGVVVSVSDDGLTAAWPRRKPPPPPLVAKVPELSKQTCVQWQRARLAIVALERNGTAEAKEVLKQLADGHPDIVPTKEAKAALGRMAK